MPSPNPGDVHGCPELFRLLEQLRYSPAVDNLILAGDLVNKGPASLDVLDAVPTLAAEAVRGNHDDAVLGAWLAARRRRLQAGGGGGQGAEADKKGEQRLHAKFAWAAAMTEQQAAVLAGLPYTISVPQYGIAVVHAGLVPGVPLEEQELWAMYKMRNVAPLEAEGAEGEREEGRGERAEGNSPAPGPGSSAAAGAGCAAGSRLRRYRPLEKAKEGGEPWAQLWAGPVHVFFGHDARRGLQLAPAATGLDTGAVYGGALTAAVLPPLGELLAAPRGGSASGVSGLAAALAAGRAPSREELGVELVTVPAAAVYSPPTGPAAAAVTAAA
ncbi:hypothetical protein GPECTOR_71g547 [Gonium pectorale]|uniref:Calcineurin-like phosphoesterase domain-containing protein n=1 Tax=Gonium pectorale TaxID=33097 RepID=A0A150G2T6_GONPE|nr:hypothetical protein GPECTOR_71g547 [Gonium pectorale]|eukprot:KXZ44186.1 hypothetical protein GPECTOR_71g547 [Gonium pectorale]